MLLTLCSPSSKDTSVNSKFTSRLQHHIIIVHQQLLIWSSITWASTYLINKTTSFPTFTISCPCVSGLVANQYSQDFGFKIKVGSLSGFISHFLKRTPAAMVMGIGTTTRPSKWVATGCLFQPISILVWL